MPLGQLLDEVLAACRPHAADLGCAEELERVPGLAAHNGADRQLAIAERVERMPDLVEELAGEFCRPD